jgi:hypothetical protein
MKNKDIEDIIIEYCEGFEHLEFNYSDLPEMVEKIKESYESLLVAAFTAGEELGHRNAKSIYRFTLPEEEVSQAAPRYAKSIINATTAQ